MNTHLQGLPTSPHNSIFGSFYKDDDDDDDDDDGDGDGDDGDMKVEIHGAFCRFRMPYGTQ